jgi:hypothetical protein
MSSPPRVLRLVGPGAAARLHEGDRRGLVCCAGSPRPRGRFHQCADHGGAEAGGRGRRQRVAGPGVGQRDPRVKGVPSKDLRIGNWLTAKQAQSLLNAPDATTNKGLRDRAILARPSRCWMCLNVRAATSEPRNPHPGAVPIGKSWWRHPRHRTEREGGLAAYPALRGGRRRWRNRRAFSHPSGSRPHIDRDFDPRWHRHCAHPAMLAGKIHDAPPPPTIVAAPARSCAGPRGCAGVDPDASRWVVYSHRMSS